MAFTDKQNFRCDGEVWQRAVQKAADMRRAGYDIDMTYVLNREVDLVLEQTPEQIAKRLGLVKHDAPVPLRRQPYARKADQA